MYKFKLIWSIRVSTLHRLVHICLYLGDYFLFQFLHLYLDLTYSYPRNKKSYFLWTTYRRKIRYIILNEEYYYKNEENANLFDFSIFLNKKRWTRYLASIPNRVHMLSVYDSCTNKLFLRNGNWRIFEAFSFRRFQTRFVLT